MPEEEEEAADVHMGPSNDIHEVGKGDNPVAAHEVGRTARMGRRAGSNTDPSRDNAHSTGLAQNWARGRARETVEAEVAGNNSDSDRNYGRT